MTRHIASVLLLVALDLFFNHCTWQKKAATMTVELDIFSGTPNPKWEIPSELVADTQKKLEGIPTLSGLNPPEDILGYRGFILISSDPATQKQTRFRVFKGVIYADNGQSFQDIKGLETWLIEQARAQGFQELFDGY